MAARAKRFQEAHRLLDELWRVAAPLAHGDLVARARSAPEAAFVLGGRGEESERDMLAVMKKLASGARARRVKRSWHKHQQLEKRSNPDAPRGRRCAVGPPAGRTGLQCGRRDSPRGPPCFSKYKARFSEKVTHRRPEAPIVRNQQIGPNRFRMDNMRH